MTDKEQSLKSNDSPTSLPQPSPPIPLSPIPPSPPALSSSQPSPIPPSPSPPSTPSSSSASYQPKVTAFTFILAFLSAIGGFLFGYDTGVVSGALIMLKPVFHMSSFLQEIFVSLTMAAAMLFSLVAGVSNDFMGRKPTIITASLIFVVGSVVLAAAYDIATLLVGRFIIGIGIGLTSMSTPMYIAECSSKHIRGRMVALFNLFVSLGQFVSSAVCVFFAGDTELGWRYVLGLAAVPAFIQFVFFFFMPESPRWLVSKNRMDEARKVLMKINGVEKNGKKKEMNVEMNEGKGGAKESENGKNEGKRGKNESESWKNKGYEFVENELKEISNNIKENQVYERGGFWQTMRQVLHAKHVKRALIIGASLQLIQQLCGINTIMYYSASIIQMSGVANVTNVMLMACLISGVNLLSACVGLGLIDKVGRRPLTLFSLFGLMLGLLVLATSFLMTAIHSPHTSLTVSSTSICSTYPTCGSCVHSTKCGFCHEETDTTYQHTFCFALNHTHAPGHKDAGGVESGSDGKGDNVGESTFAIIESGQMCFNVYNESFSNRTNKIDKLDDSLKTNNNAWTLTRQYCITNFSKLAMVGMMIYLLFFSLGMSPVPWTINSEIYPNWARSTCVSVATSVNWLSNMVVSLTFLSLVEAITAYGTFYMYSSFALISFIILFLILPETKNKKLEEIEELFKGDLIVPGGKKIDGYQSMSG